MLNRLENLPLFTKAKIVKVDGGYGAISNFENLGLEIGDEIEITDKFPRNGAIPLRKENKDLSIGKGLAAKIIVDTNEDITVTLDKVKIGDKVKVTKIKSNGEIRRRLLDMGLVKDAELKIIRSAPLGDPIEVMLNGFNLSLRLKEAEGIIVNFLDINQQANRNGWYK
ncbi:MAG: ferrous iron transport protein A [Ignavibacteria bacterium]|jgi:ferrous iron transport protein A